MQLVNAYLHGTSTPTPSPLPALPDAANVRYWFAADQGAYSDLGASVLCGDNDPVYHWPNHGGASDHGVQATLANRPIFKTGGLNGLPYLDCDGANHWFDDLLEGDQPTGSTAINPYTVFVVADGIDVTASGRFLFGSPAVSSASSAKCAVWFGSTSGNIMYRWLKAQTNSSIPNKSGLVSGPNVLAMKTIGSSSPGSFARGSHAAAMANFTEVTNAGADANSTMRFLRHGSTPASFWLGKLYEVIYYDMAVANSDCDTVIDYLKAKYAIT